MTSKHLTTTRVRIALLVVVGLCLITVTSASNAYLTDSSTITGNRFTTRTTGFCPTTDYVTTVKATNPTIYYRFEETTGTVATDSSTTPKNGVYQPTVALGTEGALRCSVSKGLTLSGTGYVTSTTLYPNPATFSLAVWFKTGATTGGYLMGFGNTITGASGNYDKHLYVTPAGQVVFGTYPGATSTITTTTPLNNNAWHMAVATQTTSGMALYIDGALVASNTNATNQVYSGYLRVGYQTMSGWPNPPSTPNFRGSLDEAAFYNGTALTAAQILAQFNAR